MKFVVQIERLSFTLGEKGEVNRGFCRLLRNRGLVVEGPSTQVRTGQGQARGV